MAATLSDPATLPARAPARHWQRITSFVVIIAAGLLVYGNSLFFDYTYFDDHELIFNNQYFFAYTTTKLQTATAPQPIVLFKV